MKERLNIIKVGGQVVEDDACLSSLLDSFAGIREKKALVIGGGRRATAVAEALGIRTRMVGGRRITDKDTLDVVTMVYAGLVNKKIVAALQKRGVNAIGLSGADLDIMRSVRRKAGEVDYGYVGDPVKVNVKALGMLLENGHIPVLCAITHDGDGQLLNTNADTVASALACAAASEYDVRLTYCFEKAGVLADPEDEGSVIGRINRTSYLRLKDEGVISGGMIPKMENALDAVGKGVSEVMITNAESLGKGSGTIVYA